VKSDIDPWFRMGVYVDAFSEPLMSEFTYLRASEKAG
jgi:hypothetical protein